VTGALTSSYRGTLELPWAASLPESRDKFSPLLLYWTLLEWEPIKIALKVWTSGDVPPVAVIGSSNVTGSAKKSPCIGTPGSLAALIDVKCTRTTLATA
jgi:hypothetical protein